MNDIYTTKKYSENDKVILQEILNALENTLIPTVYCESKNSRQYGHKVKTGAIIQKNARQTVYGKTMYKGKLHESSSTKTYPHIMPLFKKFIDSHSPDFEFSSVYVNKNVKCKKHFDSKNVGVSILVGCGNYTGGIQTYTIKEKNTV